MSASNVDKLLQEMGIDQLVHLQNSLRQQTENKREELRQMVGRRYRDVLEASNTVKRLTEIAGHLAELLIDTRQCASVQKAGTTMSTASMSGKSSMIGRREASRRLLLLHSILPMTFTSSDLLGRTFSLCIAESLQRRLSTEKHHFPATNAPECQQLLQIFSEQLIQCRIELEDSLREGLGEEVEWNSVTSLLASYALLKPQQTDTGQLLKLYLQTRMDMVVSNLRHSDSTLLGIIRQMKGTVQCVEQCFGGGKALESAFQCITQRGWCPASIQELSEDQPLSTGRMLEAEIVRVNGLCPIDKLALPSRQDVHLACSDWVVSMCSAASERVRAMCSYFERVDQTVEFAVAVSQIFKSDWPSTFMDSNALIYRQLFGDSLLQTFRNLIGQELRQIEQKLHQELPRINCQPQSLFQKRSSAMPKFDAQMASGVSEELQELVQSISSQLHQLQQNVQKYTTIGQEEQVETLHEILAEQVLAMVERLTNFEEWQLSTTLSTAPRMEIDLSNPTTASNNISQFPTSISATDSRELRSRWTSVFRLLLALVQHEPSILCQCMNRNLDRIVQCNRILHTATEHALCNFMDCVINDCLRVTNLHAQMLKCCASWQDWLDLIQEPERLQLSETVQVQLPTQISGHFFIFLANICGEINQNSLGHLFTRNVSLHVSRRIGSLLAELLNKCAEQCAHQIPLICTQLLFDCKALFQMFPDRQFLDAAQQLEAKLDPIELTVLQEPLARNAKLFAQRTSMLFGQLQAEPMTAFASKGEQLLPSYSALVDLMPRIGDVPRIMQIPRLSKLKDDQRIEEGGQEKQKGKSSRRTDFSSKLDDFDGVMPSSSRSTTTASFSSLYDKISTGWFKS